MNSNFSTPVPPVSVAMRPNFTKLPSSVYRIIPAWCHWSVPSKATFVVAVQAPVGAARRTMFLAVFMSP